MAIRVLPEARGDLRDAIRHYRAVKPPAVGKQLATRVLDAFKRAVASVASMPFSRPEHPDIPSARWVLLERFPYMVFYTLREGEMVIVAVEYTSRDYIERVLDRVHRRHL
jgi:plasmid stabilization system protein ParE